VRISEKLIKEAIAMGFSWACQECYWKRRSCNCAIKILAKTFDKNFDEKTCYFDTDKVAKKLIEYLKRKRVKYDKR